MAGTIYQLPTISADTNAGTGAMAGASQSFSQAGTVFGQLRKSILDEEQRAIENAYREKMFDENVRQFGERMGLERDQFAFNKDKWADELGLRRDEFGLNQRRLEEEIRHNRASEANTAMSNRLTQQGNAILNMSRMFEMENKKRELAADDISREFSFYTQANPEQRAQLQTAWGERAKKGDSFAQTALNHATAFDNTVAKGEVPDTEGSILNFMAAVKSDPKIFERQIQNRMDRIKAGKENAKALTELQTTIDKNADSVADIYHRDQLANMDSNAEITKTVLRNMLGGKAEVQVDIGSALKQLDRKLGTTTNWFGLGYGNTGRKLLGNDFWGNNSIAFGSSDYMDDKVMDTVISEIASKAYANGRPLTSTQTQELRRRLLMFHNAVKNHDESTLAKLMGQSK